MSEQAATISRARFICADVDEMNELHRATAPDAPYDTSDLFTTDGIDAQDAAEKFAEWDFSERDGYERGMVAIDVLVSDDNGATWQRFSVEPEAGVNFYASRCGEEPISRFD